MHPAAAAAGAARAGVAFAARREELGISQRELARMKVITGPALIAFEKGRSWPRERTRAKLEQVVQWPPGTLAQIHEGASPPLSGAIEPGRSDDGPAAVVTGAVTMALRQVLTAADALPGPRAAAFPDRVRRVLADLRTLETIATRAVRSSQGSPEVIRALQLIRHRYTELTARAAAAPGATLGQRLYTARTSAALSAAEAAAAMAVAPEVVVAVEAERPVSAAAVPRIEAFVTSLTAEELG
jgi:ribosome-binding protein aMBF1 (putative translation factor)